MASLFPFQIAMLVVPMSNFDLGTMDILPETLTSTYMRSTIKSDAAAKATYPES
jgi:hypothetical protein